MTSGTPRTIGPYEIISELGRGGMGVVYRARQPELDREVAVKVLLGGAHTDADARERFLREARAAAKLRHPHIVEVYDAGIESSGDGDLPYIAMAFIPGRSLEDVITDDDLTATQIAEITRAIADALHHAHSQGVIHRDLKPANILIDDAGRAYLTDFGLAREVTDASGLTASGAVLGTPAYMAPEQARGEAVDARVDVYGLGAALYEMCTGRPPFEGDTAIATIQRLLRDDPVPPSRIAPRIPRELELVTLTAIAKEPERRYASAAALAEDCRRIVAGEPIAARAPSLAYRLRRTLRRYRVAVTAIALTVCATTGLVWWLAVRPAQLARAADTAALQGALDARRALEARFDGAVAAGRLDDAITLGREHAGRTAPLPELTDPRAAGAPDWASLHRPPAMDLAGALLARGTAHLAAGRTPDGRRDCAEAYRLTRDDPAATDTARAALLRLCEAALDGGRADTAAQLARIAARRYGPEHPATRPLFARALDAAGDLHGAAAAWRDLAQAGGPAAGAAAERAALLGALLPIATVDNPGSVIRAADLDGDGRTELLTLSDDWTLHRRRLEDGRWRSLTSLEIPRPGDRYAQSRILLRDLDGDGRPEILVSGGEPQTRRGQLAIVRFTEGAFVLGQILPLSSTGMDVTTCDVDGDGTDELVVAVQYFERGLRIYRRTDGRWVEWCRWAMGCDPLHVRRVAPGAMLVHLAGWQAATNAILAWKPGDSRRFGQKLPAGESRPWGNRLFVIERRANGIWTERGGSTHRVDYGHIHWAADGTAIGAFNRGPGKLGTEVFTGLLRIEPGPAGVRTTALGVEWPAGQGGTTHCAWFDAPSGRRAAAVWDGRLWLASLTPGVPVAQVALPDGTGHPFAGDFDGDGDQELLLRRHGAPTARVCGLTGQTGPAAAGAALEAGVSGTLPVERELLEAGLAPEAEAACRARLAAGPHPPARYTLGLALAAQGRWRDAADAFGAAAADRALTVSALLRRLDALERLRAWSELAATAATLAALPSADAFARRHARDVRGWAGALASAPVQGEWTPGANAVWRVENPFKTRLTASAMELWDTSESRWDLAGLPMQYGGGPLRVTWRFRTALPTWATRVSFGLQALEAIHSGKHGAGPRLDVTYFGAGRTDAPTRFLRLAWTGRDGRDSAKRVLDESRCTLQPDTEYTATLEYSPQRRRAWFTLTDAAGAPACEPLQLEISDPLDRGRYTLGRTAQSIEGSADGRDATRYELLEVRLAGAVGTRLRRTLGDEPPETLARANARLVRGLLDPALADYAAVLESAEGELRVRALLFRALAHLRRGDTAAMQADITAAKTADAKTATDLLRLERAPALTAAERDALRAAFSK